MGNQRIHERPRLMSRARMHDEAGRLVDDDDVVVLVNDIERDLFAQGLGGHRRRHVDCDRIPLHDMISGVADGRVFHRDLAVEDQGFQPRPRQFVQARREHAVEPGDPSLPSTMTSSF